MIPALRTLDSAPGLIREGYAYIARRCDRLGSDAVRTRLLLRPVVCMRGAEASRIFYGDGRFTRTGAIPTSAQHLLQDEGSVQSLDGAAHRHRKAMFLDMLPRPDAAGVQEVFAAEFRAAAARWTAADEIVLHEAMHEVLTRTAARWSGVPLDEREVRRRTRELSEMVHRAASVGVPNWRARVLRRRSERWARGLVDAVRAGDLAPPPGSALAVIAAHRGSDEQLLGRDVAAVELINVLRPIVAVSQFVTFVALALARQPYWRERFAAGEEDDVLCFVQEVRRFYPFFPGVAGRVLAPFDWRGHRFAAGDLVVLDLYGTNHDPALWEDPEAFRPERFRGWSGDPETLTPQGGGDPRDNHRCPGEPMTVQLLCEAVRLLTRELRYDVPAQDLSVPLDRVPTGPRSGFVVRDVRLLTA